MPLNTRGHSANFVFTIAQSFGRLALRLTIYCVVLLAGLTIDRLPVLLAQAASNMDDHIISLWVV